MKTKNILLTLLSFVLISHGLLAQDIVKNIFFKSGEQTLTDEAKIILNQLIEEVKNLNDFEVKISAFSDDIGSAEFNKTLSTQRSANVKNYLESSGINAVETTLNDFGMVTLTDKEDIALQRSKNRRVEIKVSPFNPQKTEDIYTYYSERNRQYFLINTDRDTLIIGKNGSSIFIPANSLVTEDGQPNPSNKAKIILIEAYSNQDIILNNLSTVSDEKLLETGGMVYIEAKTSEDKNLVIKEGEELQLNLVSDKKLEPDMQLFYTEKKEKAVPANTINWVATNQPFTSNNFAEIPPSFDIKSLKFGELLEIEPLKLPVWPEEVKKPMEPQKPRYPKLKTIGVDEEKIKSLNPAKKNESAAKYTKRISLLIAKAEADIEANMKSNERLIQAYQQSLLKYDAKVEHYNNQMLSYNQYKKSVQEMVNHVSSNENDITSKLRFLNWQGSYDSEFKLLANLSKNFNSYKFYLMNESLKLGFKEEYELIKDINPSLKSIKQLLNAYQKSNSGIRSFCKNNRIDMVIDKVNNLYKNGIQNEADAKMVYDLALSPFYATESLNALISNYNKVYRDSGFLNEFNAMVDAVDSMDQANNRVLDIKSERGLISKNQAKKQFINSAAIRGLGWINCDRFGGFNELTNINLNLEDRKDAEVFVIFESFKGILKSTKGTLYHYLPNIPKKEMVKVVIVNVRDGKFEIAIKQCKVEELNITTQFEFNKCKFSDLNKILG
jgi:hypothetical protein